MEKISNKIIDIKFKDIKTDFSKFIKRNPLSDILNQINKKVMVDPIKN